MQKNGNVIKGTFPLGENRISFELIVPDQPIAAFTLAHGAGTYMSHRSIVDLALLLVERGVAVMRFNFLYS